MTLTEVVVSAVILGISSQVSLQGWSCTSQAAATAARTDQQVRLLEQRLLASRRVLTSATVADADCHWDPKAVAGVLEGLPDDVNLSSTWSFDAAGAGLWLSVELTDSDAAIPFKRSQLFTPAGLGHCPREVNDAQ
jgi:type II secretory pathway pseudopilin PulG